MKGGIMQCNKWNRLWSKRCVQRALSAGKSRVVLFSLVIGWDWHVIFKPITLRSGKNPCWLAFFLLFLTASDRTKSAHVGCQPRTNGDGRDLFGSWSWYKCCRRSKRAYLFGSFFKWLNVNAQLWVKRFILVAKSLLAYGMGPQSKHLIVRKGFILCFEKWGTLQQLNKIKAQSL